jgi:pilus assembly protein CpaE
MDDVTRVVLAMQAPEVAEEVLHLLDRSGGARVVGTAADPAQLAAAVAQLEPDAVVAEPALAPDGSAGVPLLALAPRESVSALRAAVTAGAAGFFVWPAERDGLLQAVAGVRAAAGRDLIRRATVVAVHAARGGAGCTFVATHLAQAFAGRGASCLLVDMDRDYADVSQALGADAADAGEVRTVADLVPVAAELAPAHLGEVMWHGAVLAPPPVAAGEVTDDLLRRVAEVAAADADAVVLHLPRGLGALTRWAFGFADVVLQVVPLDVMGFRATLRAIDLAEVARPAIVVNRAARAEVTPADVQRVFGVDPLVTIAHDAGAARAQDHGRLLSRRGRTGRAFDRLAATLLAPNEEAA